MLDLIQLRNGQLCVPQAGSYLIIILRASIFLESPLDIFCVLAFIVQIGTESVCQFDTLHFKDANQLPLGVDADRLPGVPRHVDGIVTLSVVCVGEGACP